MTQKDSLLKPLEFQFTEPEDVEAYGDDWHRYDERQIAGAPAKVLMVLEAEIGASITSVLNGVRDDTVFGNTAGSWLALKFAGKSVAWKDYSPATMLIEWRPAGGETGKAPASGQGPSPETVVLQHVDSQPSGSTETPDSPTS